MSLVLAGVTTGQALATPNPSLQGDLNGDNSVDITDLSILLSDYNTNNAAADINSDNTVNITDLSILLSHYGQSLSTGNVLNNPIDPNQMNLLGFGSRSHWLQPWRAWMDTPTAGQYLDRLGMAWDANPADVTSTAHDLAAAGIKRARFELGWNSVSWNEQGFTNQANLDNLLQAFKDNGIRPIILLNSNSGIPCPIQNWTVTLTAAAAVGARTIQVDAASAAQIVPNLSGFNGLTAGRANEVIFKSVSGTTVTLSKPLPIALSAGSRAADTLKYQPFYFPGTPEFEATLAGWLRYADLIRQEGNRILGNGNFDFEIWNELTFGSDFLYLTNYDDSYTTTRSDITSTDTIGEIARRTIRYLHNSGFQGALVDGFTNTTPWPSGARNEPGYSGASRHPYSNHTATGPPWSLSGAPLDATGQQTSFEPAYTISAMPEYFLNQLQTEGLVRYLYPGGGQTIGGTPVGPTTDGQMWLTEIRSEGDVINPFFNYNTEKEVLRLYAAWGGKGAIVFPFATSANGWVLVDPSDPNGGPIIQTIGNYTTAITTGTITNRRSLQLNQIADNHNAKIFSGNGTAANPDLYERDVTFVQPIQSTNNQFEVLAYVMTRNLSDKHPGRTFSLTMCCFSGNVTATALDPISNTSIPVTATPGPGGKYTFTLSLIDYPRVITIKDGQ